jgi:hypothetical protein
MKHILVFAAAVILLAAAGARAAGGGGPDPFHAQREKADPAMEAYRRRWRSPTGRARASLRARRW